MATTTQDRTITKADYEMELDALARNIAQYVRSETRSKDRRAEIAVVAIHEAIDNHDFVIDDDKSICVLRVSDNASAAFFDGTGDRPNRPSDSFPFGSYAAGAMETDLAHKVAKLLEPKKR